MPFGRLANDRQTLATIAQAFDTITEGLERAATGIRTLKSFLPDPDGKAVPKFDPKDPANKVEVGGLMKLTQQGIDVCYHLFDIGLTRYAVAREMGISFGAADHRFRTWQKRGGAERSKSPSE